MNRNLIYAALCIGALSACSGTSTRNADGGFDYATTPETKKALVPEGLDTPKASPKYFVNDDINKEGPIGKNMDIRAPSLVLPIAAGSRIENVDGKAEVWFDTVLEDKPLVPFILQTLDNFVASQNVTLTPVSGAENTFRSDWFHSESMSGMWLFEEVDKSESMRFEFKLHPKPHGRSAALSVVLIDYMKTDKSGSTKTMDLIDRERAEMSMLNHFVSQLDFEYRKHKRDVRLKRANQKFVHVSQNTAGEPAYLIEMQRDALWSNLPDFFDKYGFQVTDLNEEKFIYFVDFVKPDNSFWDSIWGDEAPIVNVDEAKYKFSLVESGAQTLLTIYDIDGYPLSEEILTEILPVMEPGLSFKDAF